MDELHDQADTLWQRAVADVGDRAGTEYTAGDIQRFHTLFEPPPNLLDVDIILEHFCACRDPLKQILEASTYRACEPLFAVAGALRDAIAAHAPANPACPVRRDGDRLTGALTSHPVAAMLHQGRHLKYPERYAVLRSWVLAAYLKLALEGWPTRHWRRWCRAARFYADQRVVSMLGCLPDTVIPVSDMQACLSRSCQASMPAHFPVRAQRHAGYLSQALAFAVDQQQLRIRSNDADSDAPADADTTLYSQRRAAEDRPPSPTIASGPDGRTRETIYPPRRNPPANADGPHEGRHRRHHLEYRTAYRGGGYRRRDLYLQHGHRVAAIARTNRHGRFRGSGHITPTHAADWLQRLGQAVADDPRSQRHAAALLSAVTALVTGRAPDGETVQRVALSERGFRRPSRARPITVDLTTGMLAVRWAPRDLPGPPPGAERAQTPVGDCICTTLPRPLAELIRQSWQGLDQQVKPLAHAHGYRAILQATLAETGQACGGHPHLTGVRRFLERQVAQHSGDALVTVAEITGRPAAAATNPRAYTVGRQRYRQAWHRAVQPLAEQLTATRPHLQSNPTPAEPECDDIAWVGSQRVVRADVVAEVVSELTGRAQRAVRLLDRAEWPQGWDTLVLYCAAMTQAATGHRSVRMPLAEMVPDADGWLVISDKDDEAYSNARLVRLPETCRQQWAVLVSLRERILMRCGAAGRRHFQHLAQRARRWLPRDRQAAIETMEAWPPAMPLLTAATGREQVGDFHSIRAEYLARLGTDQPLQANWWRSQLRTWLAEDGTPGEQIDYLLGHAVYGRHPTAAYATAPINEWATALAQRLERYLQASGWEVIAP